jgi:hypothetical protein
MIEAIGIGAAFVGFAVVVLVVSIRIGILVGLRLDRAIEARASVDGDEKPEIEDKLGREEYRGE